MAHHGHYAERRKVAREHVLAMKALWSDEGGVLLRPVRLVRTDLVVAQARSATPPAHPRRRGRGPKLFEAIADYADGWILIGGGGVRAALPELRAAFERAGRPR